MISESWTFSRRLIGPGKLAAKLGFTPRDFNENRPKLEQAGFPPPALRADEFGGDRWDEKSVDAWLDQRIPPALRHSAELTAAHVPPAAHNIEATLQQRAREISL